MQGCRAALLKWTLPQLRPLELVLAHLLALRRNTEYGRALDEPIR